MAGALADTAQARRLIDAANRAYIPGTARAVEVGAATLAVALLVLPAQVGQRELERAQEAVQQRETA